MVLYASKLLWQQENSWEEKDAAKKKYSDLTRWHLVWWVKYVLGYNSVNHYIYLDPIKTTIIHLLEGPMYLIQSLFDKYDEWLQYYLWKQPKELWSQVTNSQIQPLI